MSYTTPDANVVDRPVGSDRVQVDGEFRSLKQKAQQLETLIGTKIPKQSPTQLISPEGDNEGSDRPATSTVNVDWTVAGMQYFVVSGGTVTWNFTWGTQPANEPRYLMLRIRNGGLATNVWPAGTLFTDGIEPILSTDGVDYVGVMRSRSGAPVEIVHTVRNLKESVS